MDEYKPNPKITKKVMQQYEKIRQSGVTNMFDMFNVYRHSTKKNFAELANLIAIDISNNNHKLYGELLNHFSFYMKKYKIEQPKHIEK